MPFHVAIAGEKRGPYPSFQIIEMLRDGEVSPDVLGWETGMESWLKLRDIPAFAEVVETLENPPSEPDKEGGFMAAFRDDKDKGEDKSGGREESGDPDSGPVESRVAAADHGLEMPAEPVVPRGAQPFTRFWARMFDYLLVSAVAWQFCEIPPEFKTLTPMDLLNNDGSIISEAALLELAKIHYFALLVWHVLEGVLMHIWGATPGKAIFRLRVSLEPDGARLSLWQGLGRSFFVWAAGLGLGLFPFSFLGMAVGFIMLMVGGSTLWDRLLRTRVRQESPMTVSRILMAVGCFLLVMIVSSSKFS